MVYDAPTAATLVTTASPLVGVVPGTTVTLGLNLSAPA